MDTGRHIFQRFIALGSGPALEVELELDGIRSKARLSRNGRPYGSARISRGALYSILQNRLYVGEISHEGQVCKGQHDAIVDREIFGAAQATSAESRVERRLGDGSLDPSLLASLLWDGDGRRISPSHSTRGSRRYRYYTSRADDADTRSTPIWRVSARDIEAHILAIVMSALEYILHGHPVMVVATQPTCYALAILRPTSSLRFSMVVSQAT